jgi:hypothetical protein
MKIGTSKVYRRKTEKAMGKNWYKEYRSITIYIKEVGCEARGKSKPRGLEIFSMGGVHRPIYYPACSNKRHGQNHNYVGVCPGGGNYRKSHKSYDEEE